MQSVLFIAALAGALGLGLASAQKSPTPGQSSRIPKQASVHSPEAVPTNAISLATVHIPRAVKADDQVLKAGTYRVRLAGEPLKPAVGETPNLEQWVESLQGGKVMGKAVASIVPADQIHQVERERVPNPGGSRVEMLKGNDYLRVWINKAGNSYLIHLPPATS